MRAAIAITWEQQPVAGSKLTDPGVYSVRRTGMPDVYPTCWQARERNGSLLAYGQNRQPDTGSLVSYSQHVAAWHQEPDAAHA